MTFTFTVTNSSPVGENNGGPTGRDDGRGGHRRSAARDPVRLGSEHLHVRGRTETVSCDLGRGRTESQSATASFVGTRDVGRGSGTGDREHGERRQRRRRRHSRRSPISIPPTTQRSASVTVNPQADVSLTKTVSDPTPGADDEVVYTLTATTPGPNDATGVDDPDSLPAGLDFLDASPGCNNNNGTVTCDIGAIANGGSASVTIQTRTTAAVAGTADGTSPPCHAQRARPDPGNNQASTSTSSRSSTSS